MTQFFTSSDGIRLAYRDQGSGPVVLCLPGLTRNGRDFDFLAPHLPDCRLIRPDYRGRGASGWARPESYDIPTEARDVLELLDHLNIERAAIIGTSRGGLIAMTLAATAKQRLSGVLLNDIGPEIAPKGLEVIDTYLGIPPRFQSYEQAAIARSKMPGFANVPMERWLQDAHHLFDETAHGLALNYDPDLRQAFSAGRHQPLPDLWPLFDALGGLPLALIRGANSDILSAKTAAEMRRCRPDMIWAEVPDRGHIPFLDEPQSLTAIHAFIEAIR
ncbi:MAG: alpha/beta hydrolase [Rhodobacterales bacterium]|nr:MAG: alpha/beta hydrolase [Rhodobacterales bacterium]